MTSRVCRKQQSTQSWKTLGLQIHCAISGQNKMSGIWPLSPPSLPPTQKFATCLCRLSLPSIVSQKIFFNILRKDLCLEKKLANGCPRKATEQWPKTWEGLDLFGLHRYHPLLVQVHAGLHHHHGRNHGVLSHSETKNRANSGLPSASQSLSRRRYMPARPNRWS